ncbi:MAG: T9SS type A sorting domain-containing protein, partial [Candidatus Celaenobacter antarcticus]|nr:T9SS type A sorting domain-containing protein [Candidatus Celaenobacter antarcticus]
RDISTVSVEPQQGSSYKIELKPNYPNPANNSTRISFTSKEPLVHPEVKIYNIIGQHVVTLTCEENGAEEGFLYSVLWKGKDDSGVDAPNGVYLYNLIVNEQIAESKKLILMR